MIANLSSRKCTLPTIFLLAFLIGICYRLFPMELPPPISGDELERRLKEKIIHTPIVESFLYEGSSLMISSQPSVGKSVLAVEAGYEISMGLPLFGALKVTKPTRVWYIQMERSENESLERLQLMRGTNPAPLSNLFIDIELQALNFLNPAHLEYVIERGKQIEPGLIIIDPLYGIATGLSKDEIGSNVAKMFTILKKKLGCALWINHHTVKNTHEIVEGKKIEKDDPFYGAQWLKAHITASYLAIQGEDGVILTCKKDSHSLLLKQIKLSFDHDTFLSSMEVHDLEAWERYKLYLNSLFLSGKKTFYFNDAKRHLGCAITTLRNFNCTPQFCESVKTTKVLGHKTLYEVIKVI